MTTEQDARETLVAELADAARLSLAFATDADTAEQDSFREVFALLLRAPGSPVAALSPSPPATTRHPAFANRPELDDACGVEYKPGFVCLRPRGYASPPATTGHDWLDVDTETVQGTGCRRCGLIAPLGYRNDDPCAAASSPPATDT